MSVAGVGPKKTVGMVSLGCPKNLVDGEVMLGRLQGAGYELVAEALTTTLKDAMQPVGLNPVRLAE